MADTAGFWDDHGAGPEWATPPEIYEPIREALDGFDLDPAAGAEGEPIAATRWTAEDDGLAREWFGDVWLNPPYGRYLNPIWARYAHAQVHLAADYGGRLRSLTALVPNSTSTYWFHDHYRYADVRALLPYKVSFHVEGDESEYNATFPSALAFFWIPDGPPPKRVVEALREAGKSPRPNPVVTEVRA